MKNIFLLILLLTNILAQAQNTNISSGFLFDGEPFIKVNPNNSKHIVAVWMGFVSVGQKVKIKTRASFDGGRTWGSIQSLDHASLGYTSADPSIDFDENGNVVVAYIDYTGSDVNPINGGIYISKSSDGGQNWQSPQLVLDVNIDLPRKIIDRPWLAIDRSNGTNEGNIYVSSMNAKGAQPAYHPYLSYSNDGGLNFTFRNVDNINWLSGNQLAQPMPSICTNNAGLICAMYPSYVSSQNILPQYIFASSSDGAQSFSYYSAYSAFETSNNDPLPKKGYLLRSNPANPNHFAFFFLRSPQNDLDVYMIETLDAGSTWTSPLRINDDPIGNNKMQDLVWADFDLDGDLIVSWRDRRNSSASGYETSSEIWAAYRNKDSNVFEANFQITDQSVAYDTILAESGNDFMSIQLQNDTLHAVWGDTRSGRLNIWYQKMTIEGEVLTNKEIANDESLLSIHPNPSTDKIYIEAEDILDLLIINEWGGTALHTEYKKPVSNIQIEISQLPVGTYFIIAQTKKGERQTKFIKRGF